jgi:histidyl-tRNA synthetase
MSKQFLPTNPYKGTRDFYPQDMALRNWFFGRMREVVERHCYEEYGGPIVESFDLYAAKSGEEIVGEQVYHFHDKGDRHLAIRPEMTPTVARMVAARLETLTFPLRWYTIVNLMRYERPQKGRLREHWQLNVDLFGESSVRADLEIVTVIVDLMRAFGADEKMFKVRIGSRRFFNEVLRDVFQANDAEIVAISKAVDKRAKISREDYDKWLGETGLSPEKIQLLDEIFDASFDDIAKRLGDQSQGANDLRELFRLVEAAGLSEVCEFDFSIVRGFDYYTGTVFEVYDTSPENRRALFGGGRYDNLTGLFRDNGVSGIGFGFGDVTFQDFLEVHHLIPSDLGIAKKILIATFPDVPYENYIRLAETLRAADITASIYLDPSAKLKKQFAFAEKNHYSTIALIGADEMNSNSVVVKNMATREQKTVGHDSLVVEIRNILES